MLYWCAFKSDKGSDQSLKKMGLLCGLLAFNSTVPGTIPSVSSEFLDYFSFNEAFIWPS